MQYLDQHRTHPTVEEIYNGLVKEMPTLSRTTIYNTLQLFLEHALISGLTISGSESRFDFETTPHSHFFCKECGVVMDVEKVDCPCENRGVISGNRIDEVHLYLKGVCKNCLTKSKGGKK